MINLENCSALLKTAAFCLYLIVRFIQTAKVAIMKKAWRNRLQTNTLCRYVYRMRCLLITASKGSSSNVKPFSEEIAPLLPVAVYDGRLIMAVLSGDVALTRSRSFADYSRLVTWDAYVRVTTPGPWQQAWGAAFTKWYSQKIWHSGFASKDAFAVQPYIQTPRNHRLTWVDKA